MKVKLIVVGKTDDDYITQGIARYAGRLAHYVTLNVVVIPALKNTAALTPAQQKTQEAALIRKHLLPTDYVVRLDEGGKEYTSVQFAGFIQARQVNATPCLTFIVGGPYGFCPALAHEYKQAMSLSRLTFSHQMVRLFFIEQLYRAYTIINNQPYHHA